jgi:hypothetical protein
MRHVIGGVLVLVVALMALVPASGQNSTSERREWGVAVSVAWEQGSLLVTRGDGYMLLHMQDSTEVRDAAGARLSLADIRAGQRVEYQAEEWKGMWFAQSLSVAQTVSASDR